MVPAMVLTVAFVLWSSIRGVALQAHDPTALIVHAGLYDNLW
jgi:hypothetical protein